ncbi:MAG: RlmE family RNA methyltransferase [Gammaproteobacteria bacterium]
MDEHFADDYVKRAQRDGYRSRAVYKLEEIDDKERLLRKGGVVLDLGAAPGAWSQFAVHRLGDEGVVVAVDILPMDSLAGVIDIHGDINDEAVYQAIKTALDGREVDLVLSDMAPNMSGNKTVDQARSIQLAEMAFETAKELLKPGGDLLIKVFQGSGSDELRQSMRATFRKVSTLKPKASRARSPEVYFLARNFYLV